MFEWMEDAGNVVEQIGTKTFPATLAAGLRRVAPFDFTVVFGHVGTDAPIDLYDDFPRSKRRIFVEDYQAGPYVLDPFFLAATDPITPGLHRMREIAPDRFYQGEYFRSYYARTGLAEEIGYFIDVSGAGMVVVSLMRADKSFSAKEIRHLRALWPLVCAAGRKHWADFPNMEGGAATNGLRNRVDHAFQAFGEGVLTPREREVVEFTLKGHSAEAVGTILGISPGTVRIHRRNVYAKLRINSQGELFSKFIDEVLQ
ncbi:helix-turn-helix transcriptional regulator [Aliiruegeria lutimaris]|uniref:DNA-binding transcriptional regulator, CsgD family n=1 Tax=Aliiruegeria lutimaris TaxID=571298 RepID=A0A1G9KCR3_9RHOB|nr:LuxR C-terminal-related transcriptional regulator [Aliiruegeria lutimaris]SDL47372.1 DNA-binding transcriptional regulator, CsgD family [Aliiruegeria lutimaris]